MSTVTQLYLTNRTAPYTPATIRGTWDDTAVAVTRALDPDKVGGGNVTNASRAETSATNPWDVLLYRGVSGQLSAQTISGTIDVVISVSESNAAANFSFHLHVYVTQGDSDTPRGTLLSDYIDATEWSVGQQIGTALTSAQALSSLAVSAGDRLVVEIGYRAANAVTTSYTGNFYYGNLFFGDLVDDSEVGVTGPLAGFIAFPSGIDLISPLRVTQAGAEVMATVTPAARVTQAGVEVMWSEPIAGRWTQVGVEVLYTVPEAEPAQFTLPEAWAGSTGPVFWDRIVHRDTDGTTKAFPFAPIAITDPADYYDGYKAPVVLTAGVVACPLSDRNGRIQVPTCTVTYSDLPNSSGVMQFRGWLGRDTQRALRGAEFTRYAITDRDRRLLKTPVIVFRGYVEKYSGPSDFQFQIQARGWLARRLEQRLWTETVGDLFPGAPASQRGISLPLAIGRLSDAGSAESGVEFVLDEDGLGGGNVFGDDWVNSFGHIATAPGSLTLQEDAGNGNIPAGTYYGMWTRIVDGVESDPEPFLPEDAESITVSADAAILMTGTADGADAYRFYLGGAVPGGGGQIRFDHYIETTDPATGVTFDEAPGTLSTDAVWAFNAFGYAGVIAVMADGRTALAPGEFPNLLGLLMTGYRRPVRFAWTPKTGALHYELYFRTHPTNAFDRRFIVPAGQLNDDGNVYWEWMWGDNTAYDLVTGAPAPRGMIPPVYLGGGDGSFVDLEGFSAWHAWLISCRPCEAFEAAYFVETNDGVETATLIDDAYYSTTFSVPGKGSYAAWWGTDPYYEVDGYKLFVIFGRGPDAEDIVNGTKQLRVNVKGLEDAGDGSGDVITSIYDQFGILAKNILLTDTPAIDGDFDQEPTFSDETPRLDEDSLDQAAADAASLIGAGPAAARWLSGAMTVGQFFADWCPSAKAKVGIKPNGQTIVCVHNPNADPVAEFDEQLEIIDGSFEFEATDQGFANAVGYQFEPDYDSAGSLSLRSSGVVDDPVSQSDSQYQERILDRETLAFSWRLSAGVAQQLARAYLAESAYMPQPAKASSVLHWVHRSPGEVVSVTHRQGATATGYADRKHAILGMSIDLVQCRVDLNLLDLRTHVGDLSDFLAELFMGTQELGGSRHDSCLTEDTVIVPPNWRIGVVDWDQVPATHEVVFDVWVAVAAGTITPNLYEYDDDTGDTAIVEGTPHDTDVMTRQQHVVTRPEAGGVVEYWMLPVLEDGATDGDARMLGRLRVRRIGAES